MAGRDIAEHLGRSLKSVRHRAGKLRILKRPMRRWTPEEDEVLRSARGRTMHDVAVELGRVDSEVSSRIRKLGFACWRHIRRGGDRHAPFRGRAVRKIVNGKRIEESRAVMEECIGRPLESCEIVHHINGDPSDNRLKNLHLFPDRATHLKAHNSVSWLMPQLAQRGLIEFESNEGIYRLCE